MANNVRRFKIFQPEDCRKKTEAEKEAAIFYAMRDSKKMTSVEFAELYNPTGFGAILPAGAKSYMLHCLDENIQTILGNTDLDHAMLLSDWDKKGIFVNSIYVIEKSVWNLGKGEMVTNNFNNPAEVNSKIMAQLINTGAMKFHDFFPQYLERISDVNDPVNTSFEMKTLFSMFGDNLH